ncbi:MAG: M3 family metallopeptidase [Deltaproteobacteria bacterium]|nr:M3 family metallopeptidase [Deltaproteobacteria bacterium]
MTEIKVETTDMKSETNPLLKEFNTEFSLPPFNEIKDGDYLPAAKEAMKVHNAEIKAIIENSDEPDFKNTIESFEYSGALLNRVILLFFAKHSANTNSEIQKIAQEISPLISSHYDNISMNSELFEKVKSVYNKKDLFDLNGEQTRLLEETFKNFKRGGALLNDKDKKRLNDINMQLSLLSLKFEENLLGENNRFELNITDEKDLSGLSSAVIDGAKDAALKDEKDGWMFTLHKPSFIPFMQFADNRNLREKMFNGYSQRGNHNDEFDNKAVLLKMVRLRIEKAQLLGYRTHADYALEDTMAKSAENVDKLLQKLWLVSLKGAKHEAEELQKIMDKDLKSKGLPEEKLMAFDWFYYTEKLRKKSFDLSDSELRPYFLLENVQKGAFLVAGKLYGLKFIPLNNVPVYRDDIKVVEVRDSEDKHVGVLYLDYFPQEGKQQGAWMTEFRGQEIKNENFIHPIIVNVFNFTRPSQGEPSLLSLEEVETLFHEFGHALHGLLSDVHYPSLSGTNVSRDFVEMPSQFMENWAVEPEVLKEYAFHYETSEPISDELIQKMENSSKFNQGFITVEYLAAALLDMKWHTLDKDPGDIDVNQFENKVLEKLGLIREIIPRYKSTYFAHIFSGGYSSGYYSYIYSAVLDSDAFFAFKEQPDLFDSETAKSFKENILTKGNSDKPLNLYMNFRGREPSIEPLLIKRGFQNVKGE